MTTLAAAYGYLAAGEDPLSWQPHGVVSAPTELLSWMGARASLPLGSCA
jgi:hypothetical protein